MFAATQLIAARFSAARWSLAGQPTLDSAWYSALKTPLPPG
jgi:hypothetical protein